MTPLDKRWAHPSKNHWGNLWFICRALWHATRDVVVHTNVWCVKRRTFNGVNKRHHYMVSKNLPMGIEVVIALKYWYLVDMSRWGDLCAHSSNYLGHYCTWNLRLAIESGWLLIIPFSRDNRICHFFTCNVVEMRHTLCWCVLYITSLTSLKVSIIIWG